MAREWVLRINLDLNKFPTIHFHTVPKDHRIGSSTANADVEFIQKHEFVIYLDLSCRIMLPVLSGW